MKYTQKFLLVILVLVLTATVSVAVAQDERPIAMASLVEVYTIDPAGGFDQAVGSSLKQLYDSLFRYVDNPPQLEPWLVESWEVSDDGLTYTFKLRKMPCSMMVAP